MNTLTEHSFLLPLIEEASARLAGYFGNECPKRGTEWSSALSMFEGGFNLADAILHWLNKLSTD